ncbi:MULTISPECIES: MFS transporter [unclassified Pseudomonas]|uniref:MFS transporter n=1 Tax=unclassified Pseudomonas TaxID=196821 RepID=UPI002AC8EAA6|nr:MULTISPECIES: MFS transporter [unclassified Pseudomonas]MEB0039306.1 MFS transporter [Pseudomonas sp. MH10]MEB0076046.1 MFS transporter [Pseudomonas sp. MH10out]MEB0100153.1 MFS transporter [Pseudomonas sp. CCI3.2]MEB0119745.1 MFS transporter [Pseudomonas sp. CCI1.2]MEB0131489.1 MFS transporter [Pseudomonas sp. CCI2.4]
MREHILDDSANTAATSLSDSISAGDIAARLDRLPATRSVWTMVLLLALGSFFEFYEIFSTAYVMPGLIASGILTTTTESFFGMTGAASYIAATFVGMFLGVLLFGQVADRFGRRTVFTCALLGYSIASAIMAFQTDAHTLNIWRLVAGVFLGVEIVTIDTYLSELVPARIRGRAFAILRMCSFIAVPMVALIAYLLVPTTLLGYEGWRWVFWIGSCGALFIWFLRRGLPESPRWLASHGRLKEADAVLRQLEARVQTHYGKALPKPTPTQGVVLKTREQVSFTEIWSRHYRGRTLMLLLCQVAMGIALFGFSNWMPTFLVEHGIGLTKSLEYGLIISCVTPLGPLVAFFFADRIERKWQLLVAGSLMIFGGLLFVEVRGMLPLILAGSLITLGATVVPMVVHTYQTELYPTRNRALATGFVVAIGRLGGAMSGFLIAAALKYAGVSGALMLICGAMAVSMLSIILFGPRTRGRSLEELNR